MFRARRDGSAQRNFRMTSKYLPDDRHADLVELIATLIADPSAVRDPCSDEICLGLIAAEIGLKIDVWSAYVQVDVERDEVMKEARRAFQASQRRREAGHVAIAAIHERRPGPTVFDLDSMDLDARGTGADA